MPLKIGALAGLRYRLLLPACGEKAGDEGLGEFEPAVLLITQPLTRSLAALGIDLSPQAGRGKALRYSAATLTPTALTRAAQNLNSGILPKGSRAGLVRRLAAASA
ncbi:hypothetical protein SAMN05519103_05465 [Rhizobiales bacterium GAS113]|nr:hypothetical protein SAMN05519103_05465 [Rhizobiales bacterium GAS113]